MVHVSIVSSFIILALCVDWSPFFLCPVGQKFKFAERRTSITSASWTPDVIHEESVARKPEDVVDVIYRGLRKNSMCPFILLPYNHQ